MNLTVVYITARQDSMFDGFLSTLHYQRAWGSHDDEIKVICVESFRQAPTQEKVGGIWVWHVPVMPNIWQGPNRITKHDWWAASTARNTGLCLTGTDWVAFCDDRSALGPHWLQSVREAVQGRYVVAGAYQKVSNLKVENGRVASFDVLPDGVDLYRSPHGHPNRAVKCRYDFLFGCTMALPTEWALEVNGFDETCNSVGVEDIMFGAMLHNNDRPIYYDMRMMIYEDSTPGFQPSPPRRDKGTSPNDKSHALTHWLSRQKRAIHNRDIRAIRASVLNGGNWPVPTEPTNDWYDSEPLSQMELK